MTCEPALSGWAGRILEGLSDSVTSTGQTVSWLKYNLPKLNLSIGTDFYLNSSGCIEPNMSFNESGIYEEIHYCDYLRKRASSLLGGTSFQDVVEFKGDEQGTVRLSSFSERAKTYRSLATDCNTNLKELINWYTSNTGAHFAFQVLYNLRDSPNTYGLKDYSPPGSYYHPYNSVWGSPYTPY